MRGHRVSPSVVAGVAAVLVVLAAAGVLVAGRVADGGYRVDGPAPRTLAVNGVRLTLDAQVPIVAVSTVPGDSSRVVVDVGPAVTEEPCASYTSVRVAEQDEHRVLLTAYRYQPDATVDQADACPEPGFAGHATLDLGSPLAGRRLLEDNTDRPLPLTSHPATEQESR
jgi:hypothetical protein